MSMKYSEDKAPRKLGLNREFVDPVEMERASDFSVGNLLSGADTSGNGVAIYSVVASTPTRVRILNLEIFNNEPGWVEVEFRDGITTGGRVLGPYRLNPLSPFSVPREQLIGRYFTSAIYGMVRSGFAVRPLSNGVQVNVSRYNEAIDLRE